MNTKSATLSSIVLIFSLAVSISAQTNPSEPINLSSSLTANVSTQCKQDLEYLNQLLKRIEGDISRGSINDFINDVYYLVEELPQLYNDCFSNNQSQELLDLVTASLTSSFSKFCDAQTSESANAFVMSLASSLIESSSISNEVKSQMESVVSGLRPCLRAKKAAKITGRNLQQELSQACKQDIAWLKEILGRIKGDFERGSINDAVNDIYYLIEQLPQAYNDCVGNAAQAKEVKTLLTLHMNDMIVKYCEPSKSYKPEASLKRLSQYLNNKVEVTPEFIVETGTFVSGLRECLASK